MLPVFFADFVPVETSNLVKFLCDKKLDGYLLTKDFDNYDYFESESCFAD